MTNFCTGLENYIRKVKAHCPIHGDYIGYEYLDADNRTWVLTECPQCWEEKEARRIAEAKKVESDPIIPKLRRYGIPEVHLNSRFENYLAETQAQLEAKDAARKLAIGMLKNVVIIGTPGIGKTHLASAVMAEMLKKNPELDCGYTTEADLYADFEDGRKRGAVWTPTRLVNYWGDLDFVIIDDVQATPWESVNGTQMARLIDRRYCNGLPTMVLTNSTPEQFKAHFEDKTISRLKWRGFSFRMVGEDWRAKHGA